jgi:hypothetical protein
VGNEKPAQGVGPGSAAFSIPTLLRYFRGTDLVIFVDMAHPSNSGSPGSAMQTIVAPLIVGITSHRNIRYLDMAESLAARVPDERNRQLVAADLAQLKAVTQTHR